MSGVIRPTDETVEHVLAGAPSYRFNNLSMSSNGMVAYVDKTHIRVENAPKRTGRLIPVAAAKLVQQVKFVTIDCKEYLVVTSDVGVHLFDSAGATLLSYLSTDKIHEKIENHPENDPERMEYCCTAEGLHGTSMLLVGTSRGALAMLHYDARKKTLSVEHVACGHRRPVCAVATSVSYIASGDESGQVTVLAADFFAEHCRFPSMGAPCCSVEIRAGMIIAAFVTGVVRVYSITHSHLQIEVDAHCRALNSMAMHPSANAFATCGEDGFVNVWELPSKQCDDLRLVSSDHFKDRFLVGVSFFKDNSNKLAATAYDSAFLLTRV
ncbi:WD repeat-containing protein 54 [Hondaea fermentalgiana]|uniref:WD repeat-containing protein 54 n=1 Tax=Hondaea fermentalgiana TaxID=2315210 RepID=A0A2R5GPT9_9STRA|nr:WD repeat-containing protein 54 [Hondaea fermentalgiana]|eukprot:GBG30361.1 WD repeat-containing protein 54 [Hondaea fermentalgiana]